MPISVPAPLLAAFPPDADAALRSLAAQVDDAMLREIAEADYGHGADETFERLIPLRAGCGYGDLLDFQVREVLDLMRWSEPDHSDWKPGGTGERGHLMRSFACALLLRAAGEPANALYTDGENTTLVQLVTSALTLGGTLLRRVACLITWRLGMLDDGEDAPFFAFALLVLGTVLRREAAIDEPALAGAAEWLIGLEAAGRAAVHPCAPGPEGSFLLGLSYFDLRHSAWRALAHRLSGEAQAMPPGAARDWLQLVAGSVSAS
ncbi:MAG TPA: hypothetical protein VFH27_00980 [Longimicrobiaceae bacterium]|nr:hypothetical protein [Longimicrobiaceae bacterium]